MEHRVEQQQATEQEPVAKLCIKHCGFYGNPACLDMCSKCYREHASEQQKAQEGVVSAPAAPAAVASPAAAAVVAAAAPAVAVPAPAEEPMLSAIAEVAVPEQEKPAAAAAVVVQPAAEAAASSPERPVQANRSRCFCCNKKVGLLGFDCRCGYVFCASHRHAGKHNCSFDYKSMDREKLAKANPTVAAARVDKI